MPAYNFQKQFAEKVENGSKPHTFRVFRKDGRCPEEGQPAFLYTGMRTKNCRLLKRSTIAIVLTVTVDEDGFNSPDGFNLYRDFLRGIGYKEAAGVSAVDQIARLDGFRDFVEMKAWLRQTHGLPVRGHLVCWNPNSPN